MLLFNVRDDRLSAFVARLGFLVGRGRAPRGLTASEGATRPFAAWGGFLAFLDALLVALVVAGLPDRAGRLEHLLGDLPKVTLPFRGGLLQHFGDLERRVGGVATELD